MLFDHPSLNAITSMVVESQDGSVQYDQLPQDVGEIMQCSIESHLIILSW